MIYIVIYLTIKMNACNFKVDFRYEQQAHKSQFFTFGLET